MAAFEAKVEELMLEKQPWTPRIPFFLILQIMEEVPVHLLEQHATTISGRSARWL